VFQNYALFPHMTIAENLAFPLKARKMPTDMIEKKVKNVLDMVELGHVATRRPGQLSGGQQQRIALARALVFEPKLVLMDEPLGALDKQLREQMQYEIKRLHQKLGITILYVTHDQTEALTMSDRIAVFNEGVVQQLASPTDLYENPENTFVAQFIGENNQLQGSVEEFNSDHCVINIGKEKVKARAVKVTNIGENSTLSIRPENVVLDPEIGKFDNIFQAKTQEVIYHGDHLRLVVELLGNRNFVVKVPNTSSQNLMIGEKISLGWSSHDCHALNAVAS